MGELRSQLSANADWVVPSAALTALIAAICAGMSPSYGFLFPAMFSPVGCLILGWVFGSIWLAAKVIANRPDSPLAEAGRLLVAYRGTIAFQFGLILLVGTAMMVFTWIKSLLNLHVVFWADPMLARVDHALFLGHDPWRFVGWLAFPQVGHIYHRAWFFLMIAMLLVSAAARPSPNKSAVMFSYFALWLVVGPLIHIALPAAGPIFFERMGYGSQFSGLSPDAETVQVAQTLWAVYTSHGLIVGSGISAMPSLHIASVTWMAIAAWKLAPRLAAPVTAFAVLIFALSIGLGWHYAADGIVGAASAVACFQVVLAAYRARAAATGRGQAVQVAEEALETRSAGSDFG